MSDRTANKVALVTGGGGIGEATARLFWEEGGERVLAIAADPTGEAEAERAVTETVGRFGKLNALANVAGVRVPASPISQATAENWRRVLDVNLLAAAYCCKLAIPEMIRAGGGSIVNVSSANAVVGRRGWALYDASKAAMIALTRGMACDHAEQNVRANAVLPVPTLTPYHVRKLARREGIGLAEVEARMRKAGAQPAPTARRAARAGLRDPCSWPATSLRT